MPPTTQAEWNERYLEGTLPWDSRLPSRELKRVIDEGLLKPCRAVELGCGSGTNAIYLAEQGFQVTALDLSEKAIEIAQSRAAGLEQRPEFLVADLTHLPPLATPFEFLFDRGVYHCLRQIDLAGYRAALERLSGSNTRLLLLAGNANEQTEQGPPRVHEAEIRSELGDLFEIHWIREFRFQDIGGADGPLGWSCWMTRR
jgi:SAM-dependent methyltransferase